MMTGNFELTFERLLDWLEGRLSRAESEAVADLVMGPNKDVRAQVDWLTAFLALSRQVVIATPPPAVRATLVQRFADYAQSRRPPGFIQRLVATLTFDSSQQWAPAGLRAAESEPVFQYVFATAVADVALNVMPQPRSERYDLIGQILPSAETLVTDGITVLLLRDQHEIATTLADDLGEFIFEALEPGAYGLLLSANTVEIELPVITLTT